MPSSTPKQARFMAAIAHGWKPDRVKGPPVSVAEEFNQADKGTNIRKAGQLKAVNNYGGKHGGRSR